MLYIIRDDEGPSAATSAIIASTTTWTRSWQHCDNPSTYLDRMVKCGMQGRTIDMKCCLHAFNRCLSLGSLACIPYASHFYFYSQNDLPLTLCIGHTFDTCHLHKSTFEALRLPWSYSQIFCVFTLRFRLVEARVPIYIQLLPSSSD